MLEVETESFLLIYMATTSVPSRQPPPLKTSPTPAPKNTPPYMVARKTSPVALAKPPKTEVITEKIMIEYMALNINFFPSLSIPNIIKGRFKITISNPRGTPLR